MMVYVCVPPAPDRFNKLDPELPYPTHFMRGTAEEIWGEDANPYCVMHMTAEDWTGDQEGPTN